jgi:hypothetical protein
MTARERLQQTYALAFHPPSLFGFWRKLQTADEATRRESGKWLDEALLLHQALPASGYASQRALTRLALYQAHARAFGMVGRIIAYREKLGLGPLAAHSVPPGMVRDIALPPLSRQRK